MADETFFSLVFWLRVAGISVFLLAVILGVRFAYLARRRDRANDPEKFDETEADIIRLDDHREKTVSKDT